ncbi:MAG: hypothetical protein ACM3VT_12900 [Solirubrobacterales bacterium]
MKDEIIEEVWKAKDEIARECGYDLNKLAERLRKAQDQEKRRVVDFTNHHAADASTKQ